MRDIIKEDYEEICNQHPETCSNPNCIIYN